MDPFLSELPLSPITTELQAEATRRYSLTCVGQNMKERIFFCGLKVGLEVSIFTMESSLEVT